MSLSSLEALSQPQNLHGAAGVNPSMWLTLAMPFAGDGSRCPLSRRRCWKHHQAEEHPPLVAIVLTQ